MKLSTSLNVLFDPNPNSVESAIERCAAAGFEAVDFNFCDWCFPGSPFVGEGWEAWIALAGRRAEACGVRFTQSHGPIFRKWDDNERTRELTDLSHRSLRAAGMLGLSWVVFEPETAGGAWDAAHVESLRQRNLDWFGALLPTAESAGTGMALENVTDAYARYLGDGRWYGSIPVELAALVDGFDSPHVGACWDTGHAQIQGIQQGAALRSLGSRLKALHIQDNDGVSDQHLAPYYGKVNWSEIVTALREMYYRGDFTYEIHNFIRPLPEKLKDDGLRLAAKIGRELLDDRSA